MPVARRPKIEDPGPRLFEVEAQEVVAKDDTKTDAMNEAKAERNTLYWKTKALRLERLGTADTVETLSLALQRVYDIAKASAGADEAAGEETLRRIKFWAKTALDAVG